MYFIWDAGDSSRVTLKTGNENWQTLAYGQTSSRDKHLLVVEGAWGES